MTAQTQGGHLCTHPPTYAVVQQYTMQTVCGLVTMCACKCGHCDLQTKLCSLNSGGGSPHRVQAAKQALKAVMEPEAHLKAIGQHLRLPVMLQHGWHSYHKPDSEVMHAALLVMEHWSFMTVADENELPRLTEC